MAWQLYYSSSLLFWGEGRPHTTNTTTAAITTTTATTTHADEQMRT
jgi:hypothetical protein